MPIEIRLLRVEDDTSSFNSGQAELDQFLKQYAKQNQFKHYIGTSYVAVGEGVVVGYLSISASSIRIDEISNIVTKKLPHYPLPILRLTRLAVDKRYQKHGIGKQLLTFALQLTLKQKEQFGCFGLVVDAKEESIDFYTPFGFEAFDLVSGKLETRPFATSMFLATKVIEKAIIDKSAPHI